MQGADLIIRNLTVKILTVVRKLRFGFSECVGTPRISVILQKNHSTTPLARFQRFQTPEGNVARSMGIPLLTYPKYKVRKLGETSWPNKSIAGFGNFSVGGYGKD